jgi:hypothetical protein
MCEIIINAHASRNEYASITEFPHLTKDVSSNSLLDVLKKASKAEFGNNNITYSCSNLTIKPTDFANSAKIQKTITVTGLPSSVTMTIHDSDGNFGFYGSDTAAAGTDFKYSTYSYQTYDEFPLSDSNF